MTFILLSGLAGLLAYVGLTCVIAGLLAIVRMIWDK